MKLTPRARRRIRAATRPKRPDAPGGQELNIVPLLDIVVNLMLFLLATTAATLAVAQIDTELPSACSSPCRGEPSLNLRVTLTATGVDVATRDGRLAPGCERVADSPRPTVEGRDYAALGTCLGQLRARQPNEDEVVLSAAPAVRYEEVVRAMDAARERGFRRVRLSAGR